MFHLQIHDGIRQTSPKTVIRAAFAQNHISDGHLWMEMADARNRIVHTYDENVAAAIFNDIRERFIDALVELGGDFGCLD
ncbi:MAG: nucleotidyltransferase substrate binding protein [Defluviitaleaceae bacterium]|nr:nucleotidyltransferase substrate binding protein [Defluviitaleaceae bacterium]